MINISNLSFSYPEGQVKVLNKINLDIDEGLIYALIGPNGSGKSTLLEIIDGLILPSSGEILVDGLSTANHDELIEIRKKLSMTFQNPDNQIVGNTVERDVAFGPENLGLSKEEILKRIEVAIKWTKLVDYRFAEPHNLSGGQKQNLALASVLAMFPKYLILDEPAGMLDFISKNEVIKILKSLNSQKKITIIYSTHELDMALEADRIIVLNNGEIKKVFDKKNLTDNILILKENKITLPFWAEIACEFAQKRHYFGKYKNMETFGDVICSSLKE